FRSSGPDGCAGAEAPSAAPLGTEAGSTSPATGTYTRCPSTSGDAKLSPSRSASPSGPPAARTASRTRAPAASSCTPGVTTAPATCTTTGVGTADGSLAAGTDAGSGGGSVAAGAVAEVTGRLASTGGGSVRTSQNRPADTNPTLTAARTRRPRPTQASHRCTTSSGRCGGAGRGGSCGSDIDHLHERVRRRARTIRRKSEPSGYRLLTPDQNKRAVSCLRYW